MGYAFAGGKGRQDMTAQKDIGGIGGALPFWSSLALVPLAVFVAVTGGWSIVLMPASTWWLFTVLDRIIGKTEENADPSTPDAALGWYRAITLIWFPVQFLLLCWMLWYVPGAEHLSGWEKAGVFFGMGVIAGTIGINYSHELMHQKSRLERWLRRPAAGDGPLQSFPVRASAGASHLGRHAARSGDGAVQ